MGYFSTQEKIAVLEDRIRALENNKFNIELDLVEDLENPIGEQLKSEELKKNLLIIDRQLAALEKIHAELKENL